MQKQAPAAVLSQLRQCPALAGVGQDTLSRLTPADIYVWGADYQGQGHYTFMVGFNTQRIPALADKQFFVSVAVPQLPSAPVPRNDFSQRSAYLKVLQEAGIPTITYAEQPFPLTVKAATYDCHLSRGIQGYQLPNSKPLSSDEIQIMAQTQARMHLAAKNFAPDGERKPALVLSQGLPCGYIHADYRPRNLIFRSEPCRIAGVIDFELAHFNSFAFDTGRTLAMTFLHPTIDLHGLRLTSMADQVYPYLQEYVATRAAEGLPVSRKELHAIAEETVKCMEDMGKAVFERHPIIPQGLYDAGMKQLTQQVQEKMQVDTIIDKLGASASLLANGRDSLGK